MAEKERSAQPTEANPPTEDMDTGTLAPPAQNIDDSADSKGVNNDESKSKRGREEENEGSDKVSKKQMVEKFVEEESLENTKSEPSESIRYEHMVMLELLKKGHEETDKKIGGGIKAFQIRFHPVWKGKCFFAIRVDETFEDFSFRKCVDHNFPCRMR